MIAACPRCKTRYRIEREKMRPEGVRLRCARCEALFRVRPPEAAPALADPTPQAPEAVAAPGPESSVVPDAAGQDSLPRVEEPVASPSLSPAAASEVVSPTDPASAPSAPVAATGPVVCVAIPDVDLAKATVEGLRARGQRPFMVHDGVEAILEIQRQMPQIVVLAASLPKMFGFQVCELVKRNDSLRSIQVVLVGAVHHKDRYRRAPDELYGADAYVEEPDLPDGLYPLIDRLAGSTAPQAERPSPRAMPAAPLAPPREDLAPSAPGAGAGPAPTEAPAASPAPRDLEPEPLASIPDGGPPAPTEPVATEQVATQPAPAEASAPDVEPEDDELTPERQKAERLARIIVSDIVLYNEVRFNEALRMGNVVEALSGELAEGRALFAERVDERVRTEQDHLAVELQRVADSRAAR